MTSCDSIWEEIPIRFIIKFLLFLFPGGKKGLDQLIHLYFDPTQDVRWMQEEVCATPIMIAHAIFSFCHALMPRVFSYWEPKLIIISSITFHSHEYDIFVHIKLLME